MLLMLLLRIYNVHITMAPRSAHRLSQSILIMVCVIMHAQAEANSMKVPLRLLAQLRLLLGQGPAGGLQSTALAMSIPGTLTAEDLSSAPLTHTRVSQASICCLSCLAERDMMTYPC